MSELLILIITLLFGFHGIPADAAPLADLSSIAGNPGLVEIDDSATPLAGPSTLLVATHRKDGNATGGSGANDTAVYDNAPGNTAPATDPQTPATDPQPDPEPDPEPEPEPPATLSVAQRLLQRVNELLTAYNACDTNREKKDLLEASNYSLGNDAFRTKVLSDLGGKWEAVETEVVDATQYQQGKTLYAQVYMSGSSADFQPVVYATQNDDRSGNQWSTNLVYDDETSTWMEYVKKHPYNDSRVGYYMTQLSREGTLDALQDTMQVSPDWAAVVTPEPVTALLAATEPEAELESEPETGLDGDPAGTGGTGSETGSGTDAGTGAGTGTETGSGTGGGTGSESGAPTTVPAES